MNNLKNIDTLLKKHGPIVPLRTNLGGQTLELALEGQRVRRIKRLLAALAALAALLLVAKWLQNDIFYLLHLATTKFELVRAQSSLFGSAAWESLPKAQTATLAVVSTLWLSWRRLETLLLGGRITVRKQGLTMKLIKFTPRLTIASLLLGVAALGVSGYTYAQKAEQRQLEILRTHVNQTGRTQLDTNVQAGQCDTNGDTHATGGYEIKKGTNISDTDAAYIIQANCLEAAATRDLERVNSVPAGTTNPGDMALPFMVVQVVKITDSKIDYLLPPYGKADQSQPSSASLARDAKVIKNGAAAKLTDLHPGDLILPMLLRTYANGTNGYPTSTTVTALAILPSDPALKWYGPTLRNSLTKIQTCEGNPGDTCSFTGSIDFFPAGGGEGNSFNQAALPFAQDRRLASKEIAGVITEITATTTIIKSSSGRLFTISFGSNPAAEFNQNRAQNYNNQSVEVGDTLMVRYLEARDEHATTIPHNHIANAVLMIEIVNKIDALKKY